MIDDLPLMASPLPLLAVLVLYMSFVFVVGPKMMANRKPMNLKWIIAIYNVCQIVACTMLVIKVSFKYIVKSL